MHQPSGIKPGMPPEVIEKIYETVPRAEPEWPSQWRI